MIPKSGNCFSNKIMRRKELIPKGGDCFSDQIMRREEHDPEKWQLLFGQDHASGKA